MGFNSGFKGLIYSTGESLFFIIIPKITDALVLSWQEFKNSAMLENRDVAFPAIHKWSFPLAYYEGSGSLPSSLGWPKSSSTSCTCMSILDLLGCLMQPSSWMSV